ncbi:flagellar basal body-associated FliL family protein [Histidinibacterium lentulum]|uniref:Flagellar basal body-associated protein FliL n=1 Tax=Histidinibacterium lentulum TaxID=2480588 RepID=A0A3N2R714_9RHOB|nr:flagellar basal body-associated FliL family protein [Histidinibacterium lentulum]ROU03244.1 flagellar basal body-associated protein FliL [Histidinibacterium lentulum]
MKSLLLPAVMLLLGSGAGVGAGLFLMPPGPGVEDAGAPETADVTPAAAVPDADGGEEIEGQEYVRLNNQFVVPVVDEARVEALVVLSLSLEVTSGSRETVFSREPKLRDAFLQVLFDHANIGGFSGNFTSSSNMRVLRSGLRESAQDVLGERIIDVLIIDIVRQDVQG